MNTVAWMFRVSREDSASLLIQTAPPRAAAAIPAFISRSKVKATTFWVVVAPRRIRGAGANSPRIGRRGLRGGLSRRSVSAGSATVGAAMTGADGIRLYDDVPARSRTTTAAMAPRLSIPFLTLAQLY